MRPDQLRAWVQVQRDAHGTAPTFTGETPEQELRRFRRQVATLRQEQPFAKKWRCTSRKRRVEVRCDRTQQKLAFASALEGSAIRFGDQARAVLERAQVEREIETLGVFLAVHIRHAADTAIAPRMPVNWASRWYPRLLSL